MIIGIMGAMPDEVDQLCAKLEQVTKETYAGVEYHQGMLNGRQVVVCCAGMGKANAASTVQVLITKYGAEKIIFSGIAAYLMEMDFIHALAMRLPFRLCNQFIDRNCVLFYLIFNF